MRLTPLALTLVFCASITRAMPVATFLGKADALKARGPLAVLSSDYGVVKSEISASMLALRNERLVALKNGRKPAYCPSEQSGSLTVEEVLAAMEAIPVADRTRLQVKDAMRLHMAARFPCPR